MRNRIPLIFPIAIIHSNDVYIKTQPFIQFQANNQQ